MPAPYGVTPTGFVTKTLTEIKAAFEAAYRATFGAGINIAVQSVFGQLIGIKSEPLAEVWEQMAAVYAASFPDSASGVQLDNVCALTGTTREEPSLTHVLATVTGTPGTPLTAGRIASIAGTGVKFELLADVTIGGGGSTTGVEFAAVDSGPVPCYAGTLTVIDTPVSGWTGITNPADHFVLGADLESDSALRIRREVELRAQGNAAVEPIRAKVLDVTGVVDCYVFVNDTDLTDGDGVPPHSFEVVVNGGADADIRAAIFATKAAGIRSHGTTSGTVVDSQGISHTIKFSRPTVLTMYVKITKLADGTYAGDAALKQALVDFAIANYTVGADGIASRLAAVALGLQGVYDVPTVLISYAPTVVPVSSATIATTLREILSLDTTRITVL